MSANQSSAVMARTIFHDHDLVNDRCGDLNQALDLAVRHQDPTEQGRTHRALALDWERRGNDRRAIDHYHQALTLYRTSATPTKSRSPSTTSATPTPPSDNTTRPARPGRRQWSCTGNKAATPTPNASNSNSTNSTSPQTQVETTSERQSGPRPTCGGTSASPPRPAPTSETPPLPAQTTSGPYEPQLRQRAQRHRQPQFVRWDTPQRRPSRLHGGAASGSPVGSAATAVLTHSMSEDPSSLSRPSCGWDSRTELSGPACSARPA